MYETFEHTADVGIRVRAEGLDQLFADAARGLFSVMVENLDAARMVEEVAFELQADDIEELLHDWLAELLYTFCTRRVVLAEFKVQVDEKGAASDVGWDKRSDVPPSASAAGGGAALRLTHPTLTATARGEPIDLRRHEIDVEVKAITWHGLKVEQQAGQWLAEVIVDI
jgi:SHS2 domain-containing protein